MAENKSVAELREHGGELLCQCCKTGEPVFLTGEQGEAGVLRSREAYEARGGKRFVFGGRRKALQTAACIGAPGRERATNQKRGRPRKVFP